ncbi:MAG: hypothetical protein ACE37F_08205 [Nannocystaceae bacterium]|nr:hypothetical protein [bacterium]
MGRPVAAVAVVCALVAGCATARPEMETTALELAISEEDDLGDPRAQASSDDATRAARDAEAQAMLDDPSAERIDFDGAEANDEPVDMVTIPPDRTPSKSLMQDIVMGPSS